jgi:hypothetical protein
MANITNRVDSPVIILAILSISIIAIVSCYVSIGGLIPPNPFVFALENMSSANVNSSVTSTNANATTGPGSIGMTQNSSSTSNLTAVGNTTLSEDAPNIKALVLSKNATSIENMTGNVSGKKGHKIIKDLGLLSKEGSGTSGGSSNSSDTQFKQSQKSISEQKSAIAEENTGTNAATPTGESGPASGPNGPGAQTELTTPAASTPLTILTISPANGATGVDVTSFITATFSKPVLSSSVSTSTFTLIDSAGNSIPGAVTTTSSGPNGNTATFKPSSPLAFSKLFIARITTGVQDQDGNHLTSPKQWSFTTGAASPPGDTTPPTVVITNPFSSATGIGVNSSITGTFSEAVQSSTVSTTTFTLKAGTTSIPGTVTLSSDRETATFDPSSSLSPATSYTATITTGVRDLAGNAMTSDKTWSFTTAGASVPSGISKQLLAPTIGSRSDELTHDLVVYPKLVKVTLKFISIDVYDNHEGVASGDGEYSLYAEAGPGTIFGGILFGDRRFDLTTASVGLGLWDVGENVRLYFEPDTETSFYYEIRDLTPTRPDIGFHIFTYGYEVDGCGRGGQISPLDDYQSYIDAAQCLFGDANDRLGEVKSIEHFPFPTKFGNREFTSTEQSSTGDYAITYKISLETESLACNTAYTNNPDIHHDECDFFDFSFKGR